MRHTTESRAHNRLTVQAQHVVDELGRSASWVDLKETLKTKAVEKRLPYDSAKVTRALDDALRIRRR